MTDFGDSSDIFDDAFREPDFLHNSESPEDAVKRLRASVAAGNSQLRPELAEALMRRAQKAAQNDHYAEALRHADEAIDLVERLIDEGEVEYVNAVGRCLLFKSAITRLHQGPEAALKAFNDTIRYFSERIEVRDPATQNELALALVNKADLLVQIGAMAAAIAAQERAIRIWQRLRADGETGSRDPLASTLLVCGDTKFQTGDVENALAHYRQAIELGYEAVEDGEKGYRLFLIQALQKLARFFEQGNLFTQALEASAEAIRVVEEIVDDGEVEAENMLTALCMQRGVLYEHLGNCEAALAQFDRCRSIYQRLIDDDELGQPGAFLVRAGLANVLMCRGNMLADQKRFDEATDAYEEAVALYHEAGDMQPEEEEDETYIPYSIGVVRLNQANMLTSRGMFDEALALQELSLAALRRRLDAGHGEILPNLIAGFRKMIGICRTQNDPEKATHWINELIEMTDQAIDEGQLQYRGELALAYHLRSIDDEMRDDFQAAEQDLFRALRLFRDMADEDAETREIQSAKIQCELLERLALLYARQNRVDDALALFQKAIDDVMISLADGNHAMVFDILLAYTRMMAFVDTLINLKPENTQYFSDENRRRWIRITLDAAATGLDLCQQQRVHFGDQVSTKLFFTTKIAFFRKVRGTLFLELGDHDKVCLASADKEFEIATEQCETLIQEMELLRKKQQYFEADPAARPPGETDLFSDEDWQDRYLFYVAELRQIWRRHALCAIALQDYPKAATILQRDVEQARALVQRGVSNADRFLILSLIHCAELTADFAPMKTTQGRFVEAIELLRHRLRHDVFIDDDYFMFQHVHTAFAHFLLKHDQVEQAEQVLHDYVDSLAAVKEWPAWSVWTELSTALDILTQHHMESEMADVRTMQQQFLALHPDFETKSEIE